MQTACSGDSLQEKSNPVFLEKITYHNFLSAELAFRVVKDEIRQTEADVRHMKIVKAFFSLHLFILVYMSDQSLYHTLNKA